MASKIKVDQIEGSSGSTITVPTGQTFTITDGLSVSSLPTVTVAKGGTNLTSFAAGDVLYATGSTTLAKLPKGTAEQILSMNSGATAPEWTSVDVSVGGTGIASFTAGDILYATGATTLAKLPKGTAAQALVMNSGATAPEWGSAGGGAHTKIAEFTSSGTPTTWALDNIFTSTYDFYMIYLTNYGHVLGTRQLYWRFRTGGASGSDDTSSKYCFMHNRISRTSGAEADSNDGGWDSSHSKLSSHDVSSNSGEDSFFQLFIHKPYSSSAMSTLNYHGGVNQTNMTGVQYNTGVTIFRDTSVSHTGISFSAQDTSSGIRNGNKAFVYGISY